MLAIFDGAVEIELSIVEQYVAERAARQAALFHGLAVDLEKFFNEMEAA